MQTAIQATPPKVVHTIPATINLQEEVKSAHKQLRVAAYCRVSTKQEDQLNSYDVQRRAYTDKINGEPGWTMVGIYADKGITGTSVKKRDDFNRLMRHCKQGKVDMIVSCLDSLYSYFPTVPSMQGSDAWIRQARRERTPLLEALRDKRCE